MIIGKGYDISLWMLILADKDNRDVIGFYINKIPLTFYYMIQSSVFELEECRNCGISFAERDYKHLFGEYNDGEYVYKYNINYNTGDLDIVVYNSDLVLFSMTLLSFNSNNTRLGDNQCIGNISYLQYYDKYMRIDDYKNINYNLVKTPLGLLMNYRTNYGIVKNKICMIDLSKMPDLIYVSDFSGHNMMNKLTKTRKKSR